MKRLSTVGLILLLVTSLSAKAEPFSYPIGTKGWSFDVTAAIPLAKVVESTDAETSVDVVPMIAFGGGLTTYWVDKNDPEQTKIVSFNFPILALSAREDDAEKLDLTLIADVGFFDDKLRIGGGYYFGSRGVEKRSRFIAVFSIGTNIFE